MGELTKVDKRKIEGKEPLEVYRYLLDQKIGLFYNEKGWYSCIHAY